MPELEQSTKDGDEAVEVTVSVPAEEASEDGDTTVTVVNNDAPSGGDAVEAATVAAAIDQAGDIARLEAALAESLAQNQALQAQIADAQFTADIAREDAAAALVEAEAAQEQPSPEDDESPRNEHPWFRKIGG